MKRLATIGFIVVSLGVSTPVFAQENVGLLPTNPFYFLKEWGRSFRRAVTPSVVKKVELALQVREEKMAELNRMVGIAAERVNSIVFSLENYTESVSVLNEAFAVVTPEMAADRLLQPFVEQSLRHYGLLDALRIQLSDDESLAEGLESAQDDVLAAMASVGERLDTPEQFAARVESVLIAMENPLAEVHGAELLDRLEEYLSSGFKKEILQVEEGLLLTLSGRLQANMFLLGTTFSLDALSSAMSDPLARLFVLDQLRELVSDSALKNALGVLRQAILERTENENGITSEEVNSAIEEVQQWFGEVEALVEAGAPLAQQRMNEVIFHIEQADRLLSEGNNGGAFGQVAAGNTAVKQVFLYSTIEMKELAAYEAALRQQYDVLVAKAGLITGSKEKISFVGSLLAETEKEIVQVSRLIASNGNRDRIISLIHSIKMLVATIEALAA